MCVCVKYVGMSVYIYECICFACCLLCMYAYRERERQQNGWGLTFTSPVHAASCVIASLQLPPCPCAVLQHASCSRLLARCRCRGSLSSHHHSSACPQTLCSAQSSLGGRWSLPRDLLLCQGNTQTQSGADVGLCSVPVLSDVGTGGSISPQAVPVISMGLLLLHTMKASTSSTIVIIFPHPL